MSKTEARLTFSREERLKSRKLIAALMKEGKAFMAYPFRIVWMPLPEGFSDHAPAQAAFSVPKRLFKRAVDRNRIKRRMREAYRRHKPDWYALLEEKKIRVALLITYIAKEELPFADGVNGIKAMIRKVDI